MSQDPGTCEMKPGLEIDARRLEAWMRDHVPGYAGPLGIRQFKGGQSNPTYLLQTPGASYVLRRKPPGRLLASAHAVDREFRVIRALGEHSEVPVPGVHALCTDDGVIGTWFYVMEHVPGRIFWDPALPELPREQRHAHVLAMAGSLACLHRVDPVAAGLGDFGRPQGYLRRQIERWSGQYREDEAAGRVPSMERLIEWLPENLPAEEPSPAIAHGDYRLDNLVFHPHEPRVVAILDWELSSLGDPLADFAYHLMAWRMPVTAIAGLRGRDLAALGIPDEGEYVAHYCRLTGRDRIESLEFYMAFSMFRLAGIFHGIRGRVARGTAVSARAREYAGHAEVIADLAWQQAQAAGA